MEYVNVHTHPYYLNLLGQTYLTISAIPRKVRSTFNHPNLDPMADRTQNAVDPKF